eukprot:155740-Prymnesium_polylepis.1
MAPLLAWPYSGLSMSHKISTPRSSYFLKPTGGRQTRAVDRRSALPAAGCPAGRRRGRRRGTCAGGEALTPRRWR